jgi:aerobic-type carbon monoxide dehydrogenase small subunit (CoxS/CutS family)
MPQGRNRVSNLTITVNDKQHAVSADPDTPLLYVLRNELRLMAAKFGCGLSQCGVCSVLMDMREIRACVTPVSTAQGKSIITLEGLPALWSKTSESGKSTPLPLHPIQQAWIDLQVPQCGYCQSGMMIQAASLLYENASPTNQQIREALDGHICRCGTHMRVMAAVEKAAQNMRKDMRKRG